MLSIAIIDVLGLTYCGDTLSKRGLGGSESAIIYMAKELSSLNFKVTVFNNCKDSDCCEGIYDGVEYIDLSTLIEKDYSSTFDIVISSRSVLPFASEKYWNSFALSPRSFLSLKKNAKLKILWMHDTFCDGDQILEELVINRDIDEIFTLSDFHTSYVTNCDHGSKRNFEVLKRHIFCTRNGAKNYFDFVDIKNKDKNLFVYNASVTKGMIPLVEEIWEKIKHTIPEAKLKVIGGYYRFRENTAPDAQEVKWRELTNNPKFASLDIEFTGIISQQQIAEILSKASFMIYPTVFPETFGISSLESLLYNTPIITNRFGALEETAIEKACYLIDYPIEPNGLFPNINKFNQHERFIETAIRAYKDTYLHQQKMYACNDIKEIAGWDTIALQWKQHLFKKLGSFLSVDEFRKVSSINYKVQKIFNKRFTNCDQIYPPSSSYEQKIVIITPFFNASEYIEKCIYSITQQDYDNYNVILIDDCSCDNSSEIVSKTLSHLPCSISSKFQLRINTENKGALYNQITSITECNDSDIIILLDGDDCLINDNTIFKQYNLLYDGTVEFTYGSSWSVADNIPLISQPYPNHIKDQKAYRSHLFNWNIPYTHLRTFKKYLINNIPESQYCDENGKWFRAGGDVALFYNVIEQASSEKIKATTDVVYMYNDVSIFNDYKINANEQNTNAKKILLQSPTLLPTKRILIAIPTAKYIEPETFKSIYDLKIPNGYETEFQFFYGYNIDQIRNLIADWAARYDYLLSIDSDIIIPQDALQKMIDHDKPLVSGLYIQRFDDRKVLELYKDNNYGGVENISIETIKDKGLIEIAGCGFGCVLIKSQVIRDIGYPQFVYKSAIDHQYTISEDIYFCQQARQKGYTLYADTTIICDHKGAKIYRI